jgi:AraC-like DNA-binding protein
MLSRMRHARAREAPDPDRFAVRGYAVTHPSGTVVLPQSPEWDQLVHASRGVMTVLTDAGSWVVPPRHAVWVPGGVPHRIVMAGRVSLRTLYLAASLQAMPPQCRVVDVPPLLRELVLEAVRTAPLDLAVPQHDRLVGVLLDQLRDLPRAGLHLPTPSDARAAAVAALLTEHPDDDRTVDVLGRAVGAGRRTLERAFLAGTGLTVGQWRRRLRVLEAMRLLAGGAQVTAVAAQVGYATPSAFAAAFRAETGFSPRRFAGADTAPPSDQRPRDADR